MTPSVPVLQLLWPRGSVELPNGQYVIGRSSACDIVIDEPRVSRRHARLEVDGTDVHVVDLESRNGVFVNDRPVRRMQALAEGDVVLVGPAELTVKMEARATGVARRPGQAFVMLDPVEDEEDRPIGNVRHAEGPPTKTFEDLELIGRVAERALAAGHPQQAEALVEGHLRRILNDSLQQREVSKGTARRAIDMALRLAETLHRGEWFDYTIDLLRARRVSCSDPLLSRLAQAQRKVDRFDMVRIKKYVDTLRADGPTMEELRTAQRIQSVLADGVRVT